MLIAVTALSITSCKEKENPKLPTDSTSSDTTVQKESDSDTPDTADSSLIKVGEGNTEFKFTVFDGEKETVFLVKTDKNTVGEALLDAELISGEEGAYGLYVKTVNGVTADYDKDGKYWAFYINGEYAMSGVDSTNINEGDSYTFKIES